jgi:hypothetical protein
MGMVSSVDAALEAFLLMTYCTILDCGLLQLARLARASALYAGPFMLIRQLSRAILGYMQVSQVPILELNPR